MVGVFQPTNSRSDNTNTLTAAATNMPLPVFMMINGRIAQRKKVSQLGQGRVRRTPSRFA
jgi:surface polysaccharide O-acyltransferase-like enzyme